MVHLEYSNVINLVIGKEGKQAEAELDQAQLKLGLDIPLSFCRFGFSILGLVE